MKNLVLLITLCFPVLVYSQFSIEWHSDSVKTGFQGEDIGFDYSVTNDDMLDPMQVTWKFTRDTTGQNHIWNDYMCEGVEICWTHHTRQNTFTLNAGETLDMYHHIETHSPLDSGTWVSKALVWVEGDSANTVHEMTATLKTGITVQHNGMTVYIMGTDTFEYVGGAGYVPLAVEDPSTATALDQNTPNPAQESTTIKYSIDSDNAILRVQDVQGRVISEINLQRGSHQISIETNFEDGIYFYSLWDESQLISTRKMIIGQ